MADHEGTELVARLRAWADSYGVEQDPYLARLINALERNDRLAYWAGTNPFELLPVPDTPGVRKHLRISRRLALWRNVIIFIPLALTWYSIAEATSAFEEFVARNGASTVNFLEFWQNGYGLLPEFWRIGSVARLDVLIIVVIIAMSLVVGLLQSRAQRTDAIESQRAEHSRLALALDVSQYLHDFRDVSIAQVDERIADAVRTLHTASQDLAQAAEHLQRQQDVQSSVPNQLEALLEQLAALTTATDTGIRDAGSALESSIAAIAASVTELDRAMRTDVVDAGVGLAAEARQVEQQIVELQRRLAALLDTDR